jgi:ABC-type xylose transport system permease subunit
MSRQADRSCADHLADGSWMNTTLLKRLPFPGRTSSDIKQEQSMRNLLLSTATALMAGTAFAAPGAAVLAKKKRFDAFGSVFSVFVLLVLSNGLSLMNQPRWIASAISGAVLLVAVLLNRPQGRKV